MAFVATSDSSIAAFSHNEERLEPLELESIRALVILINQHINELVTDAKARKSLKTKCTSKIKIRQHVFFEFSEHSVFSNLYWGIENVEAAIQAERPGERTSRLKNSEKMLQVPALLDEQGVTGGIPNQYLVCCSYFYLSIVRKLESDGWQVAMHFLQALLVFPRLVFKELAPKLCRSLYVSFSAYKSQELGARRRIELVSRVDFEVNEVIEAMKLMARRYKAWLMYYQVMSYGQTPKLQCEFGNIASPGDQSKSFRSLKSRSTQSSHSYERGTSSRAYPIFEKVHPPDTLQHITDKMAEESAASMEVLKYQDCMKPGEKDIIKSAGTKCLIEVLHDSQSDSTISLRSCNGDSTLEGDCEDYADNSESSSRTIRTLQEDRKPCLYHHSQQAPCSSLLNSECAESLGQTDVMKCFSRRFSNSFNGFNLPMEFTDSELHALSKSHLNNTIQDLLQLNELQHNDHIEPRMLQNYQLSHMHQQTRQDKTLRHQKNSINDSLLTTENADIEPVGILERVISKLCFSGPGRLGEDCTFEITTIYEMLNRKTGLKYSMLKDMILDQLLIGISTSKEEEVMRASVSTLSSIIAGNKSVIEEIKKKGLQLCDLASALKRNVHEAATLIHLMSPSPSEIKSLGLLPMLIQIVCTSSNYSCGLKLFLPTPPAASLMIIEVLVTAFDDATNNTHLAAISSPRIISGLMDIARNSNLEESISLAAILVRCMRFDRNCRKYISQLTSVAPFLALLRSNQRHATLIALEFFHEVLCMPRSSAINVLQQIQKEGSVDNMCGLLLLIRKLEPEYKLLAANLLLQLDTQEDSSGKFMFWEEAVDSILEQLTCEQNSSTQQLSAFILANIGGTYAWTGEPSTTAWLIKKAGLTSLHHKNMIKDFDWLDESLQDAALDTWCSKIAKRIIWSRKPVFTALHMGLKSKTKSVSRDCLTAVAWLGCEVGKIPDDLRDSACNVLLGTIQQYVHPGLELEERVLACLCIYNYTSGRGMQKLIQFSEGVRESLRRLSNTTWMAEELLKVADYLQPNKWRISCVHTQILEMTDNYKGAVSALIYYKGQLYSGHADGSIKMWDIKGQTAALAWRTKEHKQAVTCFSLFEPGNCLLSGSKDKTIKVWQMVQKKLECVEVIATKEPIQSIHSSGELIFAITQGRNLKVFDASRKAKDLCKNKQVKCIRETEGKVYIGCTDSSIQEFTSTNNRLLEIKAPTKSWTMQSRPIHSIAVYKDWLYSGTNAVEGSKVKEWRRQGKPQMSFVQEKHSRVLAMEVVEDFIYLNCSSTTSFIQIWLRGTQQKVGRLSAGSRITSLITANDMVLCGTETGIIKGWIPL